MPQRPIREVLKDQKIVTTVAKTNVREAARMMKKANVGAVMVVDADGHLAGIFTERDAVFRLIAEGRDPAHTHLADVMTAHPQTVSPDRPFHYALMMMFENGFRHVPVVENGRPVGMVSARDALAPELRDLESEVERRKRIGEILG